MAFFFWKGRDGLVMCTIGITLDWKLRAAAYVNPYIAGNSMIGLDDVSLSFWPLTSRMLLV
jgi:hypothetical protein